MSRWNKVSNPETVAVLKDILTDIKAKASSKNISKSTANGLCAAALLIANRMYAKDIRDWEKENR